MLDEAWHRTNQNIEEGKNQYINIEVDEENGASWTLSYDRKDDKESTSLFKGLEQIDVADLMKIMCDMLAIWPCFSHAKHRYIKNRSPDPLVILACILAAAFGFGIKIMAKVSNVSYHHLRDVYTDFIYAENMTICNDIASNYIHSLPVTRVWDLEEGVIIGDADGQKFETSRHTLQSRYSSKYFGTYKLDFG